MKGDVDIIGRSMLGRVVLAMLIVTSGGCGGGAGAMGMGGGGGSGDGAETPADRQARGRKLDEATGASRREDLKRYVDHYLSAGKRQTEDVESKVLTAAKIVLGEEQARGQRESGSLGATLRRLKAAGVSPRLTANPKDYQQGFFVPDGKAMTADFQKVPADKRKATQAAISDFAAQTTTITWASYLASQLQIGLHLQAVGVAGAVVQNRKKYDIEPSPDDVAIVKKALDQVRRADELAAAGAGMSAALMAVTNGGKPAKALEDMAGAVKKSIPSSAAATDEEAKAYLDGFEEGLGDARQRYEAMLKASYGAQWERSALKGMLDQAFKGAEQATHQESEAARREERERRHASRKVDMGPGGAPTRTTPSNGGARATATSQLPSDGPIGDAIGVVDSLKSGDAKGAIKGALSFVPPGPIKMGLGLIASLF